MAANRQMTFKADLHIHSIFSDGTYTPDEIIVMAKEKALFAISITDHDSIDAYKDREIFQRAKLSGVELISGVEISGIFNNETVHILGYNFDIYCDELRVFLQDIQAKKRKRNQEIINKLNRHGINIAYDEVACFFKQKGVNDVTLGRPHIARVMISKGYVRSIQEAFDKYFKDGGSCFVMGEKYPPQVIIDKIHLANGKAVLAHPSQIKNPKIVKRLLELSFDGIEAYYSKLFLHQEKPWLELGRKKGAIITGGSDFHGTTRPFIELGCSWTPEEEFQKLVQR